MPTYDYECKECGYTFEKFQSMTEDSLTTCPECHKETLRRLIGGGMGIIFKGSGFYVNDAKGKSSTSGSAKKTEGAGS
ncbi:MAG: zinc ribbon domain-containing protein [Spirochaetales bacterium]|nr:zinc ribbon domain-containing protein [Spirochaetales bacterium]